MKFNSTLIEKTHGSDNLIFWRNLERKFEKDVHSMRGTKTPGTPSFGIVHPINEEEKISSEKQKLSFSDVGMLL